MPKLCNVVDTAAHGIAHLAGVEGLGSSERASTLLVPGSSQEAAP